MKADGPKVSCGECVGLLVILVVILGYFIIDLGLAPHVPILFAFTLLLFYGKVRGFSWDTIHEGISEGIAPGIIPIIIFLLIGVLVATWIVSGTIPTLMVYGFHLVSATYFLPMAFTVCTLIGTIIGSSFTTISTVGIAFMGIGGILGFPEPLVAGAVVSGAFLGSNISPLSGTTNLAAGIGNVDLFQHIGNMFYTVIPTALISFCGYWILGRRNLTQADLSGLTAFTGILKAEFLISPVALLPVLILFGFAWKRVPAIPTLLVGALTALLLTTASGYGGSIPDIAQILMTGYAAHTSSVTINSLLSRGGIISMLDSASLIILALALGGLLVKFGIVKTPIEQIAGWVNTVEKMITATALSSIGINFFIGEQYLSVILPGETFKDVFDHFGIERKYLTRTLADAGAAVNALVPWGVSGTFIAGTLKVKALDYAVYSFYPLLAPWVTLAVAFVFVRSKYRNLVKE
jgi:Na+:H+ antiporter, NhaC family